MFAIVNISGRQYKVQSGQYVYVDRLAAEEGSSLQLGDVLLLGGNGPAVVGAPTIGTASVGVTVLSHVRGDKVLVFKKKRRKGYQKMNGHRQHMTKLRVDSITQ